MQQPSPCIPAQPLCLEGHLHHLPFHCFNAILIPQEQKSSDIWSAKEPFFPYLLEQPQALSSVSQYEERETFTKHYQSKQTTKKKREHFTLQTKTKTRAQKYITDPLSVHTLIQAVLLLLTRMRQANNLL